MNNVESMISDLNSINSKVNASVVEDNPILPIALIAFKSNKFSTIINRDSPNSYKLRDENYVISFKAPIFARCIKIDVDEAKNASKNLLISYLRVRDQKSVPIQTLVDGESIFADIDDVITEITITPDYGWFSSRVIAKKIEIFGFSEESVSFVVEKIDEYNKNYYNFVNKYESYSKALKDINLDSLAKKSKIDQEIEDLEAQLLSVQKKHASESSELNNLLAETKAVETSLVVAKQHYAKLESTASDLQVRIGDLEDRIQQKEEENSQLNIHIADARGQLKTLLADKNLFSDELKGYAAQGAKNVRLYALLAAVPLVIMALVTYRLFDGAITITENINALHDISISDFLLSRMPFTAICIFIVHGCYHICKAFISKLMEIHRDRLQLSKLAIVARDVSMSAVEKLDLPDEVVYEYRTKLKMDLLKAHLAKELGDEYEYEPEKHLSRALYPAYLSIFKPGTFGSGKTKKEQESSESLSESDVAAPSVSRAIDAKK